MKKKDFLLKRILSFFYFAFFLAFISFSLNANTKDYQEQFEDVALSIWEFAEVGYKEYKSSELLQNILEKEGFSSNGHLW